MAYREVFDLDYAMPIQREGGTTLSLMTNGGEVPWIAHDLLKVSTVDGLFKTNILVDTMGFNAIGVRAAIELCGVDRVVFGSDFGPVPYGIKEQVQSVAEVLPNLADRDWVFWKTSNRIFHLDLSDTGAQSIPTKIPARKAA